MVDYIKQIAQDLIHEPPRGRPAVILQALLGELERLDPRDFLAAGQANLVRVRISIKDLLNNYPSISTEYLLIARKVAQSAYEVLDFYGGEGSRAVSRSFGFVKARELRTIIERDYRELALNLLPSGAWKSTVVMAGSILEAILFDGLTADATVKAKARAAQNAPKKLDLSKGEWKLHDLIKVAVELGRIPADRADAIDTI